MAELHKLCMLPVAVAVTRSSSGGVAIRYVLLVLWKSCFGIFRLRPSAADRRSVYYSHSVSV